MREHGPCRVPVEEGRGGKGETGGEGAEDVEGGASFIKGSGDDGSDKDDDEGGEGGNVVPDEGGAGLESLGRGREATLEVLDSQKDEERRPAESERGEVGFVEVGDEPDDDLVVVRKGGLGRMQFEKVLELCRGGREGGRERKGGRKRA